MERPGSPRPLACLLLLLLPAITLGQGTEQRRLLDGLLKDYDINEWPHADFDHATAVTVQLFLNSFGSLNAANMDYTIDVFLRQSWNDPRLRFETGRSRLTVSDPKMQDRIWKPDTFFSNVKDAEVHQVTMPNVLLRVSNTGDVLYSMRATLRLSCNMKLQEFPFDSQICDINIASYANTDDVIQYHWNEAPIDLPDNLEVAQFDLLKNTTEPITQHFATGNFSGLKVTFELRRQNGYHVLQTYVPTILIVIISWVSFWLDPNAVPGRVSLGVTTLLTLTTLASGIRSTLPPVSYVKAIDVWVGMCMILVFGALVEFTCVNWLANKKYLPGRALLNIPKALKRRTDTECEGSEDGCAKGPATYIEHARALDRLCRIGFPGVFLVFNIVYWPYYLA